MSAFVAHASSDVRQMQAQCSTQNAEEGSGSTFHCQYEGEREFCLVVVVELRERGHLARGQAVKPSTRLLPLRMIG